MSLRRPFSPTATRKNFEFPPDMQDPRSWRLWLRLRLTHEQRRRAIRDLRYCFDQKRRGRR